MDQVVQGKCGLLCVWKHQLAAAHLPLRHSLRGCCQWLGPPGRQTLMARCGPLCFESPHHPSRFPAPLAQEFAPAHSTGPYAYSQNFPRLLPFLGWGVSTCVSEAPVLCCAVPYCAVHVSWQHQLHVPNKACNCAAVAPVQYEMKKSYVQVCMPADIASTACTPQECHRPGSTVPAGVQQQLEVGSPTNFRLT